MKKAGVLPILFVVVLLAVGAIAEAQQQKKVPRIGILSITSRPVIAARIEGFRQGLRELGYVEGQNIFTEYRYAEGKVDRLSGLVAELVRLEVDIIVTAGPEPTRVAKEATLTIPIVMAQDPNPVGNGFVVSLARPGGKITGLSTLAPELGGKRLEILKEIVPRLSRAAILGDPAQPGNVQAFREVEIAAKALRVQLGYRDVRSDKDLETLFQAVNKERYDAVLLLSSPVLFSQRTLVAELAVKSRLPAIHYATEFVENGGLMSYGVNITELFRRTASYVDKILKGTMPADLPVEQPKKFEFVINLKAAKQIGLTIPPNVLVRADKVIK